MGVANTPIHRKEAARMRHCSQERFRQQVQFLRRQFLQDGDLPFTDVLTEEAISQALATVGRWLDRVFSPLVTLWVFLGQVLSADHSCRAGHGPGTVAKALADLTKAGELLNPQDRRGYRLPGGPGGGTPRACSTDPVVPAAPRDRCTTPSQSDPGRWLPSTRAGTLILRVHR